MAANAKQKSNTKPIRGGNNGTIFAGLNIAPIRPANNAGTKMRPVAHSFQPNSAKDILATRHN